MAKILNLDKIAPKEARELHLGGKAFVVKELSVQDFMANISLAEQMEGETSVVKQMEASISVIKRAVPDIQEADLKGLSLEQLAAVSRFVRGEDLEEAEDSAAGK